MPTHVVRRLLLILTALALAITGLSPTASAASLTTTAASAKHGCSADYFQGDRRLGPQTLSNQGLTGLELIGYRRTGNLTPEQFLAKYWDATLYGGTGGWIYPPQNGYLLDRQGNPIMWTATLRVGQYIDRFGSEYGSFLAPTGLLYTTRAIPPSSLVGTPAENCNYSNYRVAKAFSVHAGPIAPWFGQTGLGLQYQLDASLVPAAGSTINVLWLVNNGYLVRVPAQS